MKKFKEVIKDELPFALCEASYTYKLYCQTWMWDDYWWGDYEVSGSRESFVVYLTINPFVTICYSDGSVLY